MNTQMALLLFLPVLLVADVVAAIIARRHQNLMSRLVYRIALLAIASFVVTVLGVLDVVSQIWVTHPNPTLFYEIARVIFFVLSTVSIVGCVAVHRMDRKS
ncbi:MAG TPA: hypothetical protein VM621_08115 [Luteibacter sp.]|uniref:hypothetical protein n=1 Tax=Luteibacter sp. TaxID=1886636 RepID=UPI002C5E8FD5|nr:hypothetical protein [Luteibacter sp.]HVI55001.1 hypothetical protein [Luteibacter sp.]